MDNSSRSLPRNHPSVRFLALGDSYTIGEGVEPSLSWPAQLAGFLRKGGVPCEEPTILAKTGWTTDELAQGISLSGPSGTFDLVSLLIGVNNQYRGRSVEEYSREFSDLLDTAIRYAGRHPARVVVLSIPDWGVTPFAAGMDRSEIALKIDAFNAVARAVALRAGSHYVDITGVSRRTGADPDFLVPDGLHPSGALYAEWAELVWREMHETLER